MTFHWELVSQAPGGVGGRRQKIPTITSGYSSVDRTLGLGPRGHWFKSSYSDHNAGRMSIQLGLISPTPWARLPLPQPCASVAQLVERKSEELEVGGSVPPGSLFHK